jgi:hypothetical protein
MKFSSPKGEGGFKEPAEPTFLMLSAMKSKSIIPQEKLGSWRQAANQYAVEPFSTTKAFSPVITPVRQKNGPDRGSVWRTPNSKQFASVEKHVLYGGTPDQK